MKLLLSRVSSSAMLRLIIPLASSVNWVAASILALSVRLRESTAMVIVPGRPVPGLNSVILSKLVASIVPPLAMVKFPVLTTTFPPLPS